MRETWFNDGPRPVLLLEHAPYPGAWVARIGVGFEVHPLRVRQGRNGFIAAAELEAVVTECGIEVTRGPKSIAALRSLGAALEDRNFRERVIAAEQRQGSGQLDRPADRQLVVGG